MVKEMLFNEEIEPDQQQLIQGDDTTEIAPLASVSKSREEFRASVDRWKKWRDAAREDYRFVTGDQWSEEDRTALKEQGRPVITVNKIQPQVNVLGGYQRLNRYDIDFLPRHNDDQDKAKIRKGVTKTILDECDYSSEESSCFLDGVIGGIGWTETYIDWDYDSMDYTAKIRRVSPFSVYPDAESREADFGDARHLFVCTWVNKDELIIHYPEHEAMILAQMDKYDQDEIEFEGMEPLWYQRETKKVRVIQKWYKETKRKTYFLLADGQKIPQEEFTPDLVEMGVEMKPLTIPETKVRLQVFVDNVELEHMDSPYEHGEFPFAAYVAYYYGEDDIPAGVVRAVKDIQREINKRRSQELHILNTTANSGWMMEEGVMDKEQESDLEKFGSMPGVVLKFKPGALQGGKVQRIEPSSPPANVITARQEAEQEIPSVTGINEALLGTDIAAGASGKAIELKQKQATTHIAALFDNLRRMKREIAYRLWGKRGKKGLVPQYYTEETVFRIIGEDGKHEFVPVNKPMMQVDPMQGAVQTVMNDLSVGEFDIVVTDTPSTATTRISQFWNMVDAVSKLQIPGDLVFDLLIDMSDIPEKETIKQRWLERQQQAQAMQQAQLQQQAQQQQAKAQQQAQATAVQEQRRMAQAGAI